MSVAYGGDVDVSVCFIEYAGAMSEIQGGDGEEEGNITFIVAREEDFVGGATASHDLEVL